MNRSEAGRRGNQAAREKYPQHQSDAGKKGIRGLAEKYFEGSVDDAMRWLRSRQNEYAIEALVAQKHAEMLANGRETVCTELPVLCDPDEDVTFWRDSVSRQSRGRGRTC